jgi:hypothetical protein
MLQNANLLSNNGKNEASDLQKPEDSVHSSNIDS